MKKRIEFLDFAKGFAMTSIVLFHFFQNSFDGWLDKAIIFGGSGVHLFIFISGFGLGLSSQRLSPVVFYKRRFTKILIPYYTYITIIFILNYFIAIYPQNGFYAYLGHIFLFKMFDESIIGSFGTHLWFLSAIFQLYIIFPLLIKLKNQFKLNWFIVITFGITFVYWIIINILNLDSMLVFSNSGIQFLWEFCLGIVLADYYLQKDFKFWKIKKSLLITNVFIGIILTGYLAIYGGRTGKTFNDIPAFLSYTSIVILGYMLSNKLSIIKKTFITIGKISLELYLSHMVIFYFISEIILSNAFTNYQIKNILVKLFILLPITILISYFFSQLNKTIIRKVSPF